MVTLTDEAYEFLLEKVGYQIQKLPEYKRIDAFDAIVMTCPKCKKILYSFTKNCCPMCGQLIKWVNLKEQCNEDINQ